MPNTPREKISSAKKQKQDKDKRANTLMIVLSVCCGLMLIGLLSFSYIGDYINASSRASAVKVGNETYSVAEYNFYYFSAYTDFISNSGGSASLMGLDTSKSLKDQPCTVSDTEMSWADYFNGKATDSLSRMSAEYSEATKAGYTETSGITANVDNVMDYYKVQSQSAGETDFAKYLTDTYGSDMTEAILRNLITRTYIGKAYTDDLKAKYSFTDDELKAYYSKHAYEYSTYTYLYAYVGEKADASETCEKLAGVSSQTDFESLTKKLTGAECYTMKNVKGSELGTATAKDVLWIADKTRKAGDTFVGKTGENSYVLYFISSGDNGYGSNGDAWVSIAKTGLSGETFENWENALIKSYDVKTLRGTKLTGTLN